MNTITISQPRFCTKLDIWAPRYSDAYTDTEERVVLLAKYKVEAASPVILIEFTKAKHLKGQRFCISKADALKFPVDTNGKIACLAIPMSALSTWQTAAEVRDIATGLFND